MTTSPAAGSSAGRRRRSPPRPAPSRCPGGRAATALAVLLTLVVVLLAGCRAGPDGDTAAGHGDATIGQGSPPAASQAAGKAADPVRLRVPDIAVTAPVVPLDLDAAERLIAPAGFTEVGWNHAGPEPGDDGVAVIAGHVDSKTGPAVFYRLGKLHAGATVLVDRADGTTATFIVDRLAEYAKAEFPDEEVYHSGNGAQLRLITCGGTFNHDIGHYVDNVVVFAHLA